MKKGFFKTLKKAIVPLLTGFITSCTGSTDGVAPGGTTSGGSSIVITPNAITLMATNNYTFTASGGSGSYSYSIASGGGSVLATTGVYTAPGSAGTDVVRVVDGSGLYADAIVTVRPVLQISPTSQSVVLNGTISFSASGGVNPLSYSVTSGGGSVNSSSGLYTAPNSAGSAVVTVTDALGNTSAANVTISNALAISPSSYTLAVNNTHTFSASGGTGPYTFSVFSGGGSINSSSGLYTAPGTSGSAVVRVTDSLGATADANVTVNAALAISPSTKTLAVNNSFTFSASGGVTPYTFSVVSGGGSVNSTTGAYSAPGGSGSATVRVTDSLGNTSDAAVTINSALAISPASQSVALNGTINFSTTGGVSPISFSVTGGGGSVNSSTGVYTAPNSSGSATVRATDSLGNTSDASVTITNVLSISPSSYTLAVNNSNTFSASGGTGPYSFSVFSGGGSVVSSTGVYTAPAFAGSAVVRVTDSLGANADANVTINAGLAISPSSLTLAVGNLHTFSASGGVSPYTFSVFSGGGSINSSTGAYTAPGAAGSATVRVTDSLGNTSDASVTINAALAISPASQSVNLNGTINFSTTGGVSPISYSVTSGGGSVVSGTGVYTAPGSAGSATVRATDSLGNTSDASVTITNVLAISPSSYTLAVNNSHTFSASGGTAPYTFSVFSGGGSVVSSTGVYTAPASSGSAVVRVTDSLGATADANITINAALAISPSSTSLGINATTSFSASGGVSPYSYSVFSGGGSINSSGFYTAPGSTGSAVVRVTDNLGNTSDASVTITGALQISPSTFTLAVNNNKTFTASGGTSPYTYSVLSGGGTIVSSTGVYTAPSSSGSATVRVTDNVGATSDASVTINAALAISPASVTLTLNATTTFSGTGGVSPYTFSKVSGVGSIDSTSGAYTAPGSAGSAVVRITDSLGNTSDASITVTNALTISPSTPVYVETDGTLTFSATGGTGPYSFACTSSVTAIDSATGDYTAPSTSGSDVCTVTDSLSAASSATVTVYAPLTLSPSTITMAVNTTTTFTATGGQGTRTFSLVSGVGSINSSTGVYTAPATTGSAVIQVADTIGNILQANISVVGSLTITPKDIYLALGSKVTSYTATLGTSPYTFSVDSGGGSIDVTTGTYTAPSTSGTGVVRVTDAVAAADTATVYHIVPVEIKSSWGASHVCALYAAPVYANYKLKCWGYNNSGQLGLGDTNSRGDATTELGSGLPFVNLGTNKFVKKVAVGTLHTCAILDDNTVKCWGSNTYGQLGYGNTTSKGTTASQMGDNLATVNLGTGRTASEIYAFGYRTCAILDNNSTKCWGRNITGQLGLGDVNNRGDSAGEMGDSLPAIDFGTSRYAVKLAGSESTTCAVLDNGSLKCFGLGQTGTYSGLSFTYYGELGLETNNKTWGDGASEMGDSLPTVSVGLGGGESISDIQAGRYHYCVVISTGAVKCWGRNLYGQLGIENTTNKGDVANTMGSNLLAAISVSSGTTLTLMRESSCVRISGGTAKCWGLAQQAQLLTGTSVNGASAKYLGDQTGEMSGLSQINVGAGRTISKMAGGTVFSCAILDNSKIKCWGNTTCGAGNVSNGCLLTGATGKTDIGDSSGEVGDSLGFVNH